MRSPLIMVCVWSAAVVAGEGRAAAAEQCLSAADLGNVGRMASVMAMGVAVQRCSQCLGPESYPQTVRTYEAARLMDDFWKAKDALDGETLARLDAVVRDSARNFAATLSGNCDACRKMENILRGLSTAGARDKFYGTETDVIAKAPGVKTCP
jgi:hypothetical protein